MPGPAYKKDQSVIVTVSGPGVTDAYVEATPDCVDGVECYYVNRDYSGDFSTQFIITPDVSDCSWGASTFIASAGTNEVGTYTIKVVNKYCPGDS